MNIHKNARLTPHGRAELARRVVAGGQSIGEVAAAFHVCVKTARKWVERFRRSGVEGLSDVSSRPPPAPNADAASRDRRNHRATPPALHRKAYRQAHGRFERVGHRITGDRKGQSNSRGVGWEFVHVCVDDASRVAFSQIKPDEKAVCAIAFLKAAVAYYKSLGVKVARVMTDNGSCYKSFAFAFAFASACKRLRLKHIRTKPYTPKTNGKAERFIQTALREWAYATAYPSSERRAAALPHWMHRYNWHRPHGGIKYQTPISRLGLTGDNLLRLHT